MLYPGLVDSWSVVVMLMVNMLGFGKCSYVFRKLWILHAKKDEYHFHLLMI